MLIACGLLLGNKTTPNFFEISYCIIDSIVARDIFASFLRYKNIYDIDKNTCVKLTVKGLKGYPGTMATADCTTSSHDKGDCCERAKLLRGRG